MKLLSIYYGSVTGDEVDTQEEAEENGKIDDYGSQVNLNSSTREIETFTNMMNSYSDWFGAARIINKTIDGKLHTREFMTLNNSAVRSATPRPTWSRTAPVELQADNEET